jgi:hypothetical protein
MGICSQASRVGSIAAPFLLMMGAQVALDGHSQVIEGSAARFQLPGLYVRWSRTIAVQVLGESAAVTCFACAFTIVGTVQAPNMCSFVYPLLQVFIPFMAFGCLAMMSGLLIMTMPETLGAAMPETVAVSCSCQCCTLPPPSVVQGPSCWLATCPVFAFLHRCSMYGVHAD